ncbi:Metallo-dependent phosphatase [Ramicandelaber brevisporus]|nr:Metallo-dependent phosphatase [Ramicandelaber brevisporus]
MATDSNASALLTPAKASAAAAAHKVSPVDSLLDHIESVDDEEETLVNDDDDDVAQMVMLNKAASSQFDFAVVGDVLDADVDDDDDDVDQAGAALYFDDDDDSVSAFALRQSRRSSSKASRKSLKSSNSVRSIRQVEPVPPPMPPPRSPSAMVDLDLLTVEDSYEGPHLPLRSERGVGADPLLPSELGGDYFIDDQFVRDMIEWMRNENKLHKRYAYIIVMAAIRYMETQPAVVDVTIPSDDDDKLDMRVRRINDSSNSSSSSDDDTESRHGHILTVCGDVHGQFYDLLHIFEENGFPSATNMYLFNGDFVDRGSFCIEVILTLYAYKWLYPNAMLLNRGNHETTSMNELYGFKGEVLHKYDFRLWRLFEESFNALPLGHVLQNKILVVHGGLFSDRNVTLDHLRRVDRFRQPSSSVELARPFDQRLCTMNSLESRVLRHFNGRFPGTFAAAIAASNRDFADNDDDDEYSYRFNRSPSSSSSSSSSSSGDEADEDTLDQFGLPLVDYDRVMTEVLWSDPKTGFMPHGITPNPRGVGVEFGQDVTQRFLSRSGLECIIRSHQVKHAGYEVVHEGKCVTVFSAPNYCDSNGNLGAYVTVKPDGSLDFNTFVASPHPHIRPMFYANKHRFG